MSKYILLRLKAPLQSWGGESFSYSYRSTVRHPTFSGVLGLICCSLGINRSKDSSFLMTLTEHISMDVFCYKQGSIIRDFQTAGVGHKDIRKVPTNYRGKSVEHKVRGDVYHKEYLQSSDFLVILKVGSDEVTERVVSGLRSPEWMPSLGRKACIPTTPIFVGVSDKREEILSLRDNTIPKEDMVYSVVESKSGETICDVPVEFNHKYRSRQVAYSDAHNI